MYLYNFIYINTLYFCFLIIQSLIQWLLQGQVMRVFLLVSPSDRQELAKCSNVIMLVTGTLGGGTSHYKFIYVIYIYIYYYYYLLLLL